MRTEHVRLTPFAFLSLTTHTHILTLRNLDLANFLFVK
jgi:hypothetical protein